MSPTPSKPYRKGFSLIEITVVILITGLAMTSLLNLLQWGHIRYAIISDGWKNRSCMTDIRLWLRDRICTSDQTEISLKKLKEQIRFPENFKISNFKVTKYASSTYIISVQAFEDKNRNNKPENSEIIPAKVFCFRRRANS